MDNSNIGQEFKDIVIKQEPADDPTANNSEENNNGDASTAFANDHSPSKSRPDTKDSGSSSEEPLTPTSHASGPLRYISRRGRPPGGGYSMKSAQSPYLSFGQSSTGLGSHDFLRQSSLGTSASSPHDLLKAGLDSSLDSLDTRRFGLHCFEGEKNSFRCDGCDVVFGSRDTYAMHMLLRAKNESCVALPTAAISANPENPTPREKFERELREKAMINAIRSQAALMSKAAAAAVALPRSSSLVESAIPVMPRSPNSTKDDLSHLGPSDLTTGLSTLFAFDSYGLYMDQRQYRRLVSEYGLRAASSSSAISAMMEQLSCSVCGEVFTNKDALAMHMMFHTREEENESKPVIPAAWKMDPTSTLGKMMPLSINTDLTSSRGRNQNESTRTQESTRTTGDKQLTAERIAELKRMAIESSLKSSLKKHPIYPDRHPRPKSVSEDTVVTSSAQTRPLSADDAFKMSQSRERGVYKPHKTVFRSRQRDSEREDEDKSDKESTDKSHSTNISPYRKRTSSISDEYLSRLSPLYKRQRYFYSNSDLRNMGFRYDQLRSSLSCGETAFPKLCDNHVSSASGPQDSDETSNGSSTVAMDTNTTDEIRSTETGTNKSHEAASSSLENLMTSDTILVPVENLDDVPLKGVHADLARESVLDRQMAVSDSSSTALDFSVGKQRAANEDQDASYSTDSSPTRPTSRLNGHRKESEGLRMRMSPNDDTTDDNSARRNSLPQHRVELVTDGPEGADAKEGHHSDGRRSNDISSEASRVGEARYCVHCEILFLDVTLFHLHMGLHNVNNPWQCNICGLVCGGRLEFNTHVLHY